MPKKDAKPAEKDLHASLATLRKELSDSRRSHAGGELPNPTVLKNTRREIARTLTAINAHNVTPQEREKE